MQTTTPQFDSNAVADARKITCSIRAAFSKTFDPDIEFFELDTSLLDGTDVLAPSDNNVIQEWDKYEYVNLDDRLISAEVTREELSPYSITKAYADVVLNNYDDYFTKNSGSPIENYILPKRPFRILMGFSGENLPQFVGLSTEIPVIDGRAKTASIHLIDFLSSLMEKEVSSTIVLENVSTDEVLDYYFQEFGLTPSQYNLDTSTNRMVVFYAEKGWTFGFVVEKLMEAEQGRLYMDELGIIQFKNRNSYGDSPVATHDKSNTIDYDTSKENEIINYVKIKSEVLGVESLQSVWTLAEAVFVRAGETVEIWADLIDPATSVDSPGYSAMPIEGSYFKSSLDQDAVYPYTDVALVSIDVFNKTVKLVFENTGVSGAFVSEIDLWGTPIRIQDTILVEEFDQTSIDEFEEEIFEINTNYIQTRANAISKAAVLVDDYKDYGSILRYENKGNPAYQIGDVVDLDLDGYQGNHVITKIINSVFPNRFRQLLTVKQRDRRQYFILDVSELDGTDVLSP